MLSQHEAKLYFNLPATNCSCPLVVHEIAFCYPKNATIRTNALPCSHLHKLSLKSVLEIEKAAIGLPPAELRRNSVAGNHFLSGAAEASPALKSEGLMPYFFLNWE